MNNQPNLTPITQNELPMYLKRSLYEDHYDYEDRVIPLLEQMGYEYLEIQSNYHFHTQEEINKLKIENAIDSLMQVVENVKATNIYALSGLSKEFALLSYQDQLKVCKHFGFILGEVGNLRRGKKPGIGF